MVEIADPMGLICGYQVTALGDMKAVEWADMDAALADETSVVWLHFNLIDVRARNWISASTHIPSAAKAILLGSDLHMRIEPAGLGLAGVVCDLHHEFVKKSDQLDILRLYLDSHCLISARRQPLTSIDRLRQSLGEGLKLGKLISLVTNFLHHVTDTLGDLILELTSNVEDVEDLILAERCERTGEELGRIRRTAVQLRRHMVPQQHALLGLLSRLPHWVEEGDAANLRTAIERLGALGHDLDLVQERARLLQEQASARLIEATNRNLYILSIVTTMFLPMTLITGIFGMNLGGMPGLSHDQGFWYGIGIMLLTGMVTLLLLRKWKLL